LAGTRQEYLDGHDDDVCCVTVASGPTYVCTVTALSHIRYVCMIGQGSRSLSADR